MKIASGTSFLLMLFCFAKPYDCLADTCSVRNTFPQTCTKLEIGDYAKSTIRSILFGQQSVERESRMVNVRERVGTERLVNNRRIVDSDSRISNYPEKSASSKPANNDRTEKFINRDFRRSTFTDRIAIRHRDVIDNLNVFRVADTKERNVNNRKYLTRESRFRIFHINRMLSIPQQNFPKETTTDGVGVALPFNNRRIFQGVSRESAVDRKSPIVNARERARISLKDRDLTTARDATRIIRKFDVIRESYQIRSAETSLRRPTIDRTTSSTRTLQARNLKSLKNEMKETVNRVSLTYNNRSPTRSMKTVGNNGLRESLNERRSMNSEIPIQERRIAAITRGSQHSNLHQRKSNNLQPIRGGRIMLIENRNFQITKLERRDSKYSTDNRRFADQTHRYYERFAGSSRVVEKNSKNRERLSDRQLEERSLTDNVKFTERDSRVGKRIASKPNTRTIEEKLSSEERTSPIETVRKVEEQSSRRSHNDAFSTRVSRNRKQFPERSNIKYLRENSDIRRQTREDRTRRINDDSRIAERQTPITNRKSTEPSFNLRTSHMSNEYRADDRRAIVQTVSIRTRRMTRDNNRYSVSNSYPSTKDENNNERLQVNERHFNPNNYYEMMAKRTINYNTTWSDIVTTVLSVLLFAHMIGTSLDLKKYQYCTSYFNAVKEKVF